MEEIKNLFVRQPEREKDSPIDNVTIKRADGTIAYSGKPDGMICYICNLVAPEDDSDNTIALNGLELLSHKDSPGDHLTMIKALADRAKIWLDKKAFLIDLANRFITSKE